MTGQGLSNDAAHALVRPIAKSIYTADFPWSSLLDALEGYERDYGLNLAPDFQRGHVWTEQQQQRFIEGVFRGTIPPSTMVIQWTCPQWDDDDYAGELPREMQILDGLQRLTAVRAYLSGEVRPFGYKIDDFARTSFDVRTRARFYFSFAVHAFATRAEVLQHYIDINSGGTPHSEGEIERVRGLLSRSAGDGAVNA